MKTRSTWPGLVASMAVHARTMRALALNVAFDLDSFVRMLTPQGQLCLVASPLEPLSLSAGPLNNSRRSIYGNYIGSRSETVQMLEFAATHGVEAVVDVMPFDRVNEAIERIRRRDVEMALVLESPMDHLRMLTDDQLEDGTPSWIPAKRH